MTIQTLICSCCKDAFKPKDMKQITKATGVKYYCKEYYKQREKKE